MYLALGDSLAVGVGATSPERGYVGRLFTSRRSSSPVTTLSNIAVSGETSGSLIEGGQLARAVDLIRGADPPVALVTLDIGGNDLLHLLNDERCASAPEGTNCRRLVAVTLHAFEANYRSTLEQLREALDASAPEAVLAVMTYFNPFSGTDAAYEQAGDVALLGSDGAVDCAEAAADARARGMNDIIACVGRDAGALVADVHPRFVGLGLELTHIGSEDIHANDPGYEVIADAFEQVLSEATPH